MRLKGSIFRRFSNPYSFNLPLQRPAQGQAAGQQAGQLRVAAGHQDGDQLLPDGKDKGLLSLSSFLTRLAHFLHQDGQGRVQLKLSYDGPTAGSGGGGGAAAGDSSAMVAAADAAAAGG